MLDSCTCEECVSCCKSYPGWFTPDEALRAIEAGFASRFMLDWFEPDSRLGNKERIFVLSPAGVGFEGRSAPEYSIGELLQFVVTGTNPIDLRCTFLTQDEKCEIHNTLFKPVQCRSFNQCDESTHDNWVNKLEVAKLWEGRQDVVEKWKAVGMRSDGFGGKEE